MPCDKEIDFTSSGARKRMESWPVCPRRVRYYQFKSESGCRSYGLFTIDARQIGSFLNEWLVERKRTLRDRRLVDWLMDSDEDSDLVLDFPREWPKLETPLLSFIRKAGCACFCVACNREYAASELKTLNDPLHGSKRAYLYDRFLCPGGHLLLEVHTIRLIRGPSFHRGKAEERPTFDELRANLDEDGYPINKELFESWGYSASALEAILGTPVREWAPKSLVFQNDRS